MFRDDFCSCIRALSVSVFVFELSHLKNRYYLERHKTAGAENQIEEIDRIHLPHPTYDHLYPAVPPHRLPDTRENSECNTIARHCTAGMWEIVHPLASRQVPQEDIDVHSQRSFAGWARSTYLKYRGSYRIE
jgi:hypothetical protein